MHATHTKRASIHTLGCRLNQSESQTISERLRAAGYAVVPFGEPADLGIIHTCTVTREADAKARKAIKGFIRANPHAFTVVIGCYAQLGYAALAAIPGVDAVIGNQEKLNLLAYVSDRKLAEPLIVRDRIQRDDFTIDVGTGDLASGPTTRSNLKIQDGCDFMCTYCVIPFARGRARSRELENLVHEARLLAASGVREVVLTGVNLGTYAQDGRDIVDVVDALNAVPDLARIRISSIEPTTIPEGLFDRMADPRHALTPYLHIPLQSGANRTLERMHRRYTREEFRAFIEMADARVPDLCIGTDVMVGMPGETDADFNDTRELIAHSPIAYAHVFKYSERRNTPAVRMPDKVDPRVMQARSAELRQLSAAKRNAFNARYVGRTVEVLFEQQDHGHWTGYTGNYVRAAVRSDQDLTNVIAPVAFTEPLGDIMIGNLHECDCPV